MIIYATCSSLLNQWYGVRKTVLWGSIVLILSWIMAAKHIWKVKRDSTLQELLRDCARWQLYVRPAQLLFVQLQVLGANFAAGLWSRKMMHS